MELKQAFWILRHGSGEGLREYLKAVKTIEDSCVPVVRCRDCKRWQRHSEVNRDYGDCRRYSSTMRYDDFCSQGERRGDNGSASMSDN